MAKRVEQSLGTRQIFHQHDRSNRLFLLLRAQGGGRRASLYARNIAIFRNEVRQTAIYRSASESMSVNAKPSLTQGGVPAA